MKRLVHAAVAACFVSGLTISGAALALPIASAPTAQAQDGMVIQARMMHHKRTMHHKTSRKSMHHKPMMHDKM